MLRRSFERLRSRLLGEVIEVDGVRVDLASEPVTDTVRTALEEGYYERAERELLRTHADPRVPALDIGAGLGYTSAVLAEVTADGVPTVAVEANPELRPGLRRTEALNGADFRLVSAAYGADPGERELYLADDFWSSSPFERRVADPDRRLTVDSLSLDGLLNRGGIEPPFQLVVDIEGAEYELLDHELGALCAGCTLLVVEFHDVVGRSREAAATRLEANGFERVGAARNVAAFANTRVDG